MKMPLSPSSRIARSASLMKAAPPHGRMVALLNVGGIVAPLLDRRQLFMVGLAAQIMRGIGHHADVDAVLIVGLEKVLEHHGAAALAPSRPALAVQRAEIVGRLFRSIDVRMPIDDHADFSSPRSNSACTSP